MKVETHTGTAVEMHDLQFKDNFLSYFEVDNIIYYGMSKVADVAIMNATRKYHDHACNRH